MIINFLIIIQDQMELKYLQTFRIIVDTGSFLHAAKRLNYTQSTITFQMQQLEQELSVKLFERIGRKMHLTQAGNEILPYVDIILQNVEYLENFKNENKKLHGSLRIALPESLLTYQMQPVLKAFHEQAPNVQLSLQTLNCFAIRDQIVAGNVDMGIHYDVGGYGSTMMIEKLKSFSLTLAANFRLDEDKIDFTSSNQSINIQLLSNDPESIYQKRLDHYLKEKKITLSGTMEMGGLEAIKRSLLSNLGISYLPTFIIEDELKQGTLKALKTDIKDNIVTAVCVYHKNKWITPAMELFIQLLHQLWM